MNDTANPQDAWDILDCAARHRTESIAIVDRTAADHVTLTYRQLHRRAAGLADFLRRSGLVRGDMVAVMLHNCHQAQLWRHNPCFDSYEGSLTQAPEMTLHAHTQVLELHFAAAALHAVVVNINTGLVARCARLGSPGDIPFCNVASKMLTSDLSANGIGVSQCC